MKRGAQRTKTERFLPYAYERFGVALDIVRVVVDGIDRTELAHADSRIVQLEDRHAEHVDLEITAGVERSVLDAVLPEQERALPPVDLLLAIRCAKTRFRRGIVLAHSPVQPGVIKKRISLFADHVMGSVELVPYLVRARAGSPSRHHASHIGARLAGARPWSVRFDLERPSAGQFLEIRYEPFSALPDAERWKSTLYRLDAEQDDPILWLNSEQRELSEILSSNATTGRRARIRDVFFDHIACAIWTQLFFTAADALCSQEGSSFDWCEGVLDRFLPHMFPERRDRASRIEELETRWRTGSVHEMAIELDRVLQRDLQIVRQMTKLIEEAIE